MLQTETVNEVVEDPVEQPSETEQQATQHISIREVKGNFVSDSVQTDITCEHLSQLFNDLNFGNSKIYTLETKLHIVDLK